MTEEQTDLQKLKKQIEAVMKSDDRLWDEEGILDQIKLIEFAVAHDETIINLLYSDENLRQIFFLKVKDAFIFKTNAFQFFMEENKVDNSFTAYKNRIGLTDGKKFIKDANDVVLKFPYKDCILEGGQSTEEGLDEYYEYQEEKEEEVKGQNIVEPAGYKKKSAAREEIFYNETVAHDEIDRLLDAKAFINWKRYNKNGEHEVEKVNRHADGTISENMVIKGNNLLALHSLKKQFAGKIKLIYIDPPYNTGDDSFSYNDNFPHSTWLTFMKNRLEVAKDLLSKDGVIFVQIDNSPSNMKQSPEFGYLHVMMDEIFERKNYLTSFVWKKKGNPSNTKGSIGTITESILLYAKNIDSAPLNLEEYKRVYRYEDENGEVYNLDPCLKTDNGIYKRSTMKFPIKTKEGVFHPPENKRWTMGKKKAQEYIDAGKYVIREGKFFIKKSPDDYIKGENKLYNNLLTEHGSLKLAKDEIRELGFEREAFDSPKPEILMQRILEMGTNENDIVLDYHLGSGTTCAIAHKMGRQYIGIEQMDYIEDIAIKRMNKVIAGEQGGISESVNWHGGGEFIYCELAKWNEQAKEEIQACKELKQLEVLWSELCNKYFLHYNVKIKEFKEKVIKEEEFRSLSLESQKEMFSTMLDNNQLYVHYSEMDDSRFKISASDRSLAKEFYKDG